MEGLIMPPISYGFTVTVGICGGLTSPEVFFMEEDDLYRDVVPEHPDHVLGETQHLREARVVHPVSRPSQRVTDQMSGGVHVCWFHSHCVLSFFEHIRNVLQWDVLVRELEGGEGCLATHVLTH